jgi:hypothetical protein
MTKLISLLFFSTAFLIASTFTHENKIFKYDINVSTPLNIVISLTNQKSLCNTQLKLLNEDMEVIFNQTNHQMSKNQKNRL